MRRSMSALALLAGIAGSCLWAQGVAAQPAPPCLSNETVSLSVSAPGPIFPHDSETVKWDLHGRNVQCDVSLLRLYYRDATTGILRLVAEQHFPVPSSGSVTEPPQSSGTYVVRAFVG